MISRIKLDNSRIQEILMLCYKIVIVKNQSSTNVEEIGATFVSSSGSGPN